MAMPRHDTPSPRGDITYDDIELDTCGCTTVVIDPVAISKSNVPVGNRNVVATVRVVASTWFS